jgi:hypothetical protein
MSERVGSMDLVLSKGITPAGSGKAGQAQEVVWNILGHTYWLKAECDGCFIFETLDPPGTFCATAYSSDARRIHIHAGWHVRSLSRRRVDAGQGRRPCAQAEGPHGYYNRQNTPARALFSVSPAELSPNLGDGRGQAAAA